MSTLATLVVKLVGDIGGFTRSMQQAQGETRTLSRQVSGSLGGVGAGAVAMGNLIAAGVQAGIGALTDLGREAMQSYANYERLEMSLQSLLAREMQNEDAALSMAEALDKSAESSKDLIKWVEDLAVISPFKSEDISNVMQLSMSFGATSNEAKQLTQDLVDYAAATGKGGDVLDRMALSLGQMRANGKLTGMEVRELALAGLPVKQILAKAFNTTQANIESMISGGLIPADKAIKAISESIEKDFGGAAQRQAGTFSGLLSSLEDIKTVGLREFFTGTFRAIQPYVQKFVDLLSSNEFKTRIRAIGEAVGQVAGNVMKGLGAIIGWIQENWPQIEAVIKPVIEGIIGGLQSIFNWVQTNGPQIQQQFTTAWNNVRAMVEPVINAIGQFITTVFGTVRTVIQTHGEEVKGFISNTWNTIRSIVEPVITWFYNTVQSVFGGLATWINENQGEVQRIFQGVWDGIKMGVGTVLELIRGVVQTVLALLRGDVQGALDAVKQTFVNIWEGIKGYVGQAVETMRMILAIIWFKIRTAVENAWNGIRTGIETAWESILNFFRSLPETLFNIGKQIMEGLWNGVKSMFENIARGLEQWWSDLITNIKNTLGIQSPSKVFASIGEQLMAGLAAGINAGANLPQLALQGALSDVTLMARVQASPTALTPDRERGSSVTVQVFVDRVASDVDLDVLAWRVARAIKQRQ